MTSLTSVNISKSIPKLFLKKLERIQTFQKQHEHCRRLLFSSYSGGGNNDRNVVVVGSRRNKSSAAECLAVVDEHDHSEELMISHNRQLRPQVQAQAQAQPQLQVQTKPQPQPQPQPQHTTAWIDLDPEGTLEEQALDSPVELTFTGSATIPITSKLHLVTPEEDVPSGIWPIFRIQDESGRFRDPSVDIVATTTVNDHPTATTLTTDPNLSTTEIPDNTKDDEYNLDALKQRLVQLYPFQAEEIHKNSLFRESQLEYPDIHSKNTLLRAYRVMVRLREMDTILQNAQRQGRISFYMTCRGEEAIHIGCASALDAHDTVLAQYREAGVIMWRGFTLEQFTNQCFSNDADLGKGRQMPIHYGSRALNYQTISSPLGTQIPQAVGVAYRHKLAGKPNVAVCFFGDGCASTTDFHSGLNFAATLGAPVIFFCRNNGYAISTPVTEQYAGDGIVSRAPGYGIAGIRVDGNDIFAVNAAVREARDYALRYNRPVLIEAMSYRQGHHSTSDDSTRYRCSTEVKNFEKRTDPFTRIENFLKANDWFTEDQMIHLRNQEKVAVLKAMEQAERRPPPPLEALFTDVYHELTPALEEQQAQLHAHLKKHEI